MNDDIEPMVGRWYCCRTKGQLFQVIDVNDDGAVEIQRFDGDLEVLDGDAWNGMDIEFAEPPEDWTGPIDDLDPDDLSYSSTDMEKDDWRSGTGEYPRGREAWEPDDDEAALDDDDSLG